MINKQWMTKKERKTKYFVFLSLFGRTNDSQYVTICAKCSRWLKLVTWCSALEHIWWCTGKCMHGFFRRKNVGMWLMNRLRRHTSVWWNCFHVKWCILISPVLLLVSIGWNQSNLQTFSGRNLVIEKSEQSVSFVNIQKYSGKLFEERRDGRVWFHISAQTMYYFGLSQNKNSW